MFLQSEVGYQETCLKGQKKKSKKNQEHALEGVNIFPRNWKSTPALGRRHFPNVHLHLMLKYMTLVPLILRRSTLESPPSFRRYNNGLCRGISLAPLTAWQSPLIIGISRGRRDNVLPSTNTGCWGEPKPKIEEKTTICHSFTYQGVQSSGWGSDKHATFTCILPLNIRGLLSAFFCSCLWLQCFFSYCGLFLDVCICPFLTWCGSSLSFLTNSLNNIAAFFTA